MKKFNLKIVGISALLLLSNNAFADDEDFINGFVKGSNYSCYDLGMTMKDYAKEMLKIAGKKLKIEEAMNYEINNSSFFNSSQEKYSEMIMNKCNEKDERNKIFAKDYLAKMREADEIIKENTPAPSQEEINKKQQEFAVLYGDCITFLLANPSTWNMDATQIDYPSCKKLLQLSGDALSSMIFGKKK